MKHADYKNILKGVSTLDVMKKNFKAILFLVILTAFSANVFGGHSTLDIVDPTFNPEIVANLYGGKIVQQVRILPDGKILVFGNFSSYNRVPTGKLVRLNPDGSLDPTFNNQTVTSTDEVGYRARIILQPDGKIVLASLNIVANGQAPKSMVRLNSDGTLDPSFNYTLGYNFVEDPTIDSLGRIAIRGLFSTPQGQRELVRLNEDGSLDTSFNFVPGGSLHIGKLAAQGNRLIVYVYDNNNNKIYRLNENGSQDSSFTITNGEGVNYLAVQPDGKILFQSIVIRRLNVNGGIDDSFQTVTAIGKVIAGFKIADDGKIIVPIVGSVTSFRRFLPNGAEDPSFDGQYSHPAYKCFTIDSAGGIIIGDQSNLNNSTLNINNFVRLTPGGVPDPAFNPGGIGFQNILPGSIRAIDPQPDGKILLGGKFDVVNGVSRIKLARLNADSSVDVSFQINTSGTGDYFSILRDIYQIRTQSDGKIVVSGWFDYVQGGAAKRNFVRLNPDGSIDTTFILTESIDDFSEIVGAGRNRFATLSDGKLLVGTSKLNGFGLPGPLKLTAGGSRDTSFTSALNTQSPNIFIDDVAIQPDGKVLVAGWHNTTNSSGSFVARLNPGGSLDSTFLYTEEPGRLRALLALLPDGKILVSKHSTSGTIFGKVERLNADGTPDNTFNSLSIPGGVINALLVLPNGKIFVGGKFTVTVNGQQTKNLLRLSADGSIEPTNYNVNDEILSLAVDGEGRLLVGGSFTVINTNGGAGANRTYIARLTDSPLFDYDGDGKADISVFRPSENKWYILQSSNLAVVEKVFAVAGDVPVPADYDGDGKTDVAIFRPSSGDWWYLSSINSTQINVHFGQSGDIPRPSDFDGDGKADFIVYRPSNSVWYRFGSTGVVQSTAFGIAEDKPLVGDFDGDGKSDLAIFRPSTGDWWYAASASGGVFLATHWGQLGDVPVPADYDGDGKTDFAVFRPSDGGWYILKSSDGSFITTAFGLSGDKPVAADYDGDGKADIAVFRPSTGIWYLLQTTAGFGGVQWGISTDIPTENAFLP